MTSFIVFSKKRIAAVNAFFMVQFIYCQNRMYKNKIKRLHERYLRLIYNVKRSSFENILEMDNSVSMCYKNLQARATEMFKVHTKTSPETMQDAFSG